jgi:phospholipid/cholesterol/gamma-HCH transport system permease protein
MTVFFKKFIDSIAGVGSWFLLVLDSGYITVRRPPSWNLFLDQFFNIGVLSLPVVAITGFSTGLVLAAQSFYTLADKGLATATGLFVGKAMLTEIGPVLTAFMVTGRVGSSMCAVIGTMRVTEQIDALKSMSVNPISYLIVPRIIGSMVMMPLLTIFSACLGIYGGYLISVFVFGMTPQAYFEPIPDNVKYFDVWSGIIKALFFGLFISTIACYKGINTRGGAAGVGKSITGSVVACYTTILIFNFLLTMALNIAHVTLQEKYGWQ